MKYSKNDSTKFGWTGLTGWPYNESSDFKNASATYFEVTGSHGKVMSKRSDRIYYVIEGNGEFEINGTVQSVSEGDVMIVPKRTPYDYTAKSKTLKLFLVHTPAYSAEDEVQLS